MIPKECKRLAEVDFPIAVVSKHSAREKSIRHGHPSTLHLWWARRPLAACRAMLMALLLPDPCDNNCPEEFISSAREILLKMQGHTKRWESEIKTDEGLRKIILEFIGDFADWDNSANMDYLETARKLVKAAHPEETPLVVDPFAGGGSIPLEALRVGCEAFASDLNPVACLILKVMLEDIPRHGPELAEELKRIGKEIKKKAELELKNFYPDDPDGAKPIAYLWARTVKCESPNCGAEIPLLRSFWLAKKINRKRALKYRIIRSDSSPPHIEFEIFEPKSDKEVPNSTVTRAKATCLCCGTVLPPERVRAQLSKQHGGADVLFDTKSNRIGGARILAVVSLHPGIQGRNYRLPIDDDYRAVWKTQKYLKDIIKEWERGGKKGLSPVLDEPVPPRNGHRSTTAPRIYGINTWRHMFTDRQILSLISFARLAADVPSTPPLYDAIKELLSLTVSKLAERLNVVCDWMVGVECSGHIFSHHDIPAGWDFSEAVPVQASSGSFESALNVIDGSLKKMGSDWHIGQVEQSDACRSSLPDESAEIWFTDPPYYDSVAYSDLSNLFYTWLKRAYPEHRLLHDEENGYSGIAPKAAELTVTTALNENSAPKTSSDFESGIYNAFSRGRRVLNEKGIAGIVFAHKTTEGWEALLSAIVNAGWIITSSWPIATERISRQNARNTASLATSVHLVCRPRANDAPVGDWVEVLRELPNRVGNWMERLQEEGIRGADLVFACIGPALEIYSRYSRVETADGREVKLAEYLEKVWEVVGRMALEQVLGTEEAKARNGMALSAATSTAQAGGTLEEDARLTALFLWTLQATNGNGEGKRKKLKDKGEEIDEEIDDDEDEPTSKGKVKGFSLVFDVVRRFAQPLGIDLPKWEGRVIETKKGVVRLMAVSERAKQLFGAEGTKAAADWVADDPLKQVQLGLFPEGEQSRLPKIKGRKKGKGVGDLTDETASQAGVTTLDRVHAAMLLQSGGQANALRMVIKEEQDRGPEFIRLANALSALYPKGSEEKRLLDAMLLAVPR